MHRFTVEVHGAYDSNVLYNDLVTGLYRGGFLSSEVRQRSMDQLGAHNRAGYLLGGTATFAWGDSLFGKVNWMPRISIGYHSVMGARFAKDAYALSFFGNALYEGLTAHLGPGAFHQINYQTIAFGVEDRRTGSFLELALVQGLKLNTATLSKADLFTAMDGRYLELELDGSYQRSDTAENVFGGNIGAAISLAWKRPISLFGSDALLSVGINDLGFVAWNGNALSVDQDSTIRYEGVEVTDILDLDGVLVDNATLQDSLGLGYERGAFTTLLPAQLEARFHFGGLRRAHRFGTLYAYSLSVDQRYLPGYIPHAALARNFVLSKWLVASAGAGYGGFGGLRAQVGLHAMVGKSLRVGVATPNAVGLCSPQARGKALAFCLEARW